MSQDIKNIKQIPYGISDYGLIRRENYYYVDKTPYLVKLQGAGRFLFFIRPRRFGKSLFLALMEAYFDVHLKDRFEEFFKGTWIYDRPTADQGEYLILFFNFSMVDPHPERVETSFLSHVKDNAVSFLQRYEGLLSVNSRYDYYSQSILESSSASDILSKLLLLSKDAGQKLYVIIDEYDNFSNTILTTSGKEAYHTLTHGAGFFRSFFNVLKGGTSRVDSPITRSFITGVSPITMDDVTSGYNIGKHVSIEPLFNRMLGFTRDDVSDMIEYYRSKGMVEHSTDYLLEIMTEWYGHYKFSEEETLELYNTDMVLYFIDHYLSRNKLPDDLIDRNVRIDYGKLRHLVIVDKAQEEAPNVQVPETNGNFSRLKKIIETGGTSSQIAKGFPLEKLTDTKHFISLLFYLGLLTVKGADKDKIRLVIPNETVRRLYYDYIEEAYRETRVFAMDLTRYSELMTGMAYDGQWRPLFDFLTERMRESMALRDLITGEKSIQAFLNVYLGLSDLYILHGEKELNKGYADVVMEPFLARYEGIKYAYLLEIKYIKPGKKPHDPKSESFMRLKSGAEAQLKNYGIDEKLSKKFENTRLIKVLLIFRGHEAVHIEKVD